MHDDDVNNENVRVDICLHVYTHKHKISCVCRSVCMHVDCMCTLVFLQVDVLINKDVLERVSAY